MDDIIRPFVVSEGVSFLGQRPQTPQYDLREALAQEPERVIRVLVVDDDSVLLEDVVDTLRNPLLAVRAANDAEIFYRQFEEEQPDVVIIDLAMPAHDGTDILRWLEEHDYGGAVVLISGRDCHILETARRMAMSYGLNVSGVLKKPFAPEQIEALVRPSPGWNPGAAPTAAALADRRIQPYFQPKIDLKTGKVVGAEALSRWIHPSNGLLMPQSYLAATSAAGGQSVHDLTILERTLEFCNKLNAIDRKMSVAVNFSIDVILGDYLLEVIADALRRHAIAPEQLTIELTETEAVQSYDGLVERLLKLRLAGVHLAIDNFGTGHSTLSRIQQLPASEIKIDRSFISGLAEYSGNVAIVRSIVELAHDLQLRVVAEGVETLKTVEILSELGCDQVQGYLFSPAVNEATFIALVRDEAYPNPCGEC